MKELDTNCPVCGYDLGFAAWNGDSASDEICPCCGIQFGYTDFEGGDLAKRADQYIAWRRRWIAGGMIWDAGRSAAPQGWNPIAQLARIAKSADGIL
jgi:hypothetical protein